MMITLAAIRQAIRDVSIFESSKTLLAISTSSLFSSSIPLTLPAAVRTASPVSPSILYNKNFYESLPTSIFATIVQTQ